MDTAQSREAIQQLIELLDKDNKEVRAMEKVPSFQEFVKLLNENGREIQAQDFSLMAWYLEDMILQFNLALNELNTVKSNLAKVTEQQAPSKPVLSKMVEALEVKVEQARRRLVAFQGKIIAFTQDAVDRFKDAGVSALDNAVAAMHVKTGLEHLQESLQDSLSGLKVTMGKVEEMGVQLRQGFRNIANAGRIAANKELDADPKIEGGRFQSAVLAPMRIAQKVLSNINNNTLAAIGAVEDLEQSADKVRDRRAERMAEKPGKRLAKKPSIRQALAEKKAEAAARAAPTPERERKAPEAAL